MKRKLTILFVFGLSLLYSDAVFSQINCFVCHSENYNTWELTVHGNSQQNAPELAGDVGHSPAEQIADEDCISCHGPRAVRANGGMTEAEALGYFYTTATDSGTAGGVHYDVGDFYPGTVNQHESEWPNINCQTCHNYDTTAVTMDNLNLALFDSHYVDPVTGEQGIETPVYFPHELCGQCHGSLNINNQGTTSGFEGGFYEWQIWAAQNPSTAGDWIGTNHLLTDGWKFSKHSNTQFDVAGELSEERVGETPDEVINGEDPEDCIACHAPYAVTANGGMTEAETLDFFFTTTDGVFTANTVAKNTDKWPSDGCVTCHDPHTNELAIYNSTTKTHVPMASSDELCGQCHGTLRFPDTDHHTYDLMQGTGGIGVPDQQTMPGISCVECHMAVDHTTWPGEHHFNEYMTHGHTWQVIVNGGDKSHHPENHPEWTGWSMGAIAGDMADHGDGAGNGDAPHVASCTACHSTMDADSVRSIVETMQQEFATLDATANVKIAAATDSLQGSTDSVAIHMLQNAQFNLAYVEGDESAGVHNHKYTTSLLNNVISISDQIISGVEIIEANSNDFVLHQNFPNPFNNSTQIQFKLPKAVNVTIEIFNLNGQKIKSVLNNKHETVGTHSIEFNATGLPSGIYYCSMRAGNSLKAIKMYILH